METLRETFGDECSQSEGEQVCEEAIKIPSVHEEIQARQHIFKEIGEKKLIESMLMQSKAFYRKTR